ncbi:MAG: hypothetical protein HQ502_11665, partial [Alphaproteobacteria bacterium]|nr:hypothetical protein [Alphaproteobacteria bacterium]
MTVSEAAIVVPEAAAATTAAAGKATRRPSDAADWGKMGRRLVFVDDALEADFRTAERNRNLGQARFVLWLALAIQLAFAAIDPWVLPAGSLNFILLRSGLLT